MPIQPQNFKRQSRRTARQTLLLDPDEAAYWLAATSYAGSDDTPALPSPPSSGSRKDSSQPVSSTNPVRTLHEIRRPSFELAPLKTSSSPQLDTLLLPAFVIDETPRAAKCQRHFEDVERMHSQDAVLRAQDSPFILSPCIATRPGSCLTYASPETDVKDKHSSRQSVRASCDSRLSYLGASVISAFPIPPETARSIVNPETASFAPERKMSKVSSDLANSKPLPALPSMPEGSVDDNTWSSDSSRSSSEVSTVLQHRPMCPYAGHRERMSDQCDCHSSQTLAHGRNRSAMSYSASCSAPDLLDFGSETKEVAVYSDDKQTELNVAKKILNRLSDEIRSLQVGPPRSAARAIRWQDEESSYDHPSVPTKDSCFQKLRTYEMLPSSDTGPVKSIAAWTATVIASTQPTTYERAHRSSRSLDVNQQSTEPPALRRALYGQRSFDCLTDSYESAVTSLSLTSPPQSARRLISTVRSHDRHQVMRSPASSPSPVSLPRQAVPSSTSRNGTHHRQTSSKSSASSSAGSSLPTHRSTSSAATTSDSLSTNTPPRHTGRSPLKLWPSRSNSPLIAKASMASPKRGKTDADYFQSAIDPFPIDGQDVRTLSSPSTTISAATRQPGWRHDALHGLQSRTYFGASPKLAGPSKGAGQTFLGAAL